MTECNLSCKGTHGKLTGCPTPKLPCRGLGAILFQVSIAAIRLLAESVRATWSAADRLIVSRKCLISPTPSLAQEMTPCSLHPTTGLAPSQDRRKPDPLRLRLCRSLRHQRPRQADRGEVQRHVRTGSCRLLRGDWHGCQIAGARQRRQGRRRHLLSLRCPCEFRRRRAPEFLTGATRSSRRRG